MTGFKRVRRRRQKRAQAIVETALLLPVMLALFTFGVLVGQMTSSAIDGANAARAAAIGAAYEWWDAASQSTQANEAMTLACAEQTGNGETCSESSCSQTSSNSVVTGSVTTTTTIYTCTFKGTTDFKTLTLTDFTNAVLSGGYELSYNQVNLYSTITPLIDIASSLNIDSQASSADEQ